MRARLIALSILCLIVALPIGIYWYFFTSNVSTIIIRIDTAENFSVRLEGTLDNDSIAIADGLLVIEESCRQTCTLGPIAPVRYTLTLTSTGKTTITDDIILGVGEEKVLSYVLSDELSFELLDPPTIIDTASIDTMIQNARSLVPGTEYILIGTDIQGRALVERLTRGIRQVGRMTLAGFEYLYDIPDGVGTLTLDTTGQYLLAPIGGDGTLVLSPDTRYSQEIPIRDITGFVRVSTETKIYTPLRVLMSLGGSYTQNPRFTDWIDLPGDIRIGYIDGADTERLSLSNFSAGQSVLISVDRQTGESITLKRGVDIERLYYIGDSAVYRDRSGQVWKITL